MGRNSILELETGVVSSFFSVKTEPTRLAARPGGGAMHTSIGWVLRIGAACGKLGF